jgi:hypothetical protein
LRFRASHLVVPAYLVFTLVLTWPLAIHWTTSVPAVFSATDPFIQSFILGWDFHSFGTGLSGIFNAPNFHPFPRTLTYMDHLIGEAFVAWPLHAATGRIAIAYNGLIILASAVSAWAVYRLTRFQGLSRPASFLAGFLFAFSPYRFSNLGLLNQSQTQFLPLGLYFGIRYFDRLETRWFVATAAAVLLQAWFGWYYAFYLGLALGLLLIYRLVQGHPVWRPSKLPVLLVVVVGTSALLLPGLWPYFEQQRAVPAFKRTLGMTLLYSADLLDYLKLNLENWLARDNPVLGSAQGYWPGAVTVLFAIVAVTALLSSGRTAQAISSGRAARIRGSLAPQGPESTWLTLRLARRAGSRLRALAVRWSWWGYFLLLAAAGFLFSLGPVLQVGGRRLLIPLPYGVAFFAIPGFTSLRAPCRFAVLVALGLSVLAGFGFHVLSRAARRRSEGSPSRVRGTASMVLFSAALLLALVTSWSLPLPLVRITDPAGMPPVYHWIAAQPENFAVLELPMPRIEADETPLDAERQLYAIYHGKRRLDGVSGFVPPEYHVFRRVMQGFPREGTLLAAARMGARYIVFHYGDLKPEDRAAIRTAAGESPALETVASFGDDLVYEIRTGGR